MSNARSRQLAYFKDNIQTQDDQVRFIHRASPDVRHQDEFDASQYYYNRDDQILPSTAVSSALVGATISVTLS